MITQGSAASSTDNRPTRVKKHEFTNVRLLRPRPHSVAILNYHALGGFMHLQEHLVMALYDTIGRGYSSFRRPDPRIAAAINAALGDAATIANIGAGAGSYEPLDRNVVAVEPSEVMISQRHAGSAPCIQGSADALPLADDAVDAAMAILSAHHWPDLERGVREMARIARKRIVLLTWVPPPDSPPFWLTQDYFPQILAHDRTIFPSASSLSQMLQDIAGAAHMSPLPIPHDCMDGMLCAYWRRPEYYLDEQRRSAISSFSRIDAEPGLEKLRADLSSGCWLEKNRPLMNLHELDAGYRIVRCELL